MSSWIARDNVKICCRLLIKSCGKNNREIGVYEEQHEYLYYVLPRRPQAIWKSNVLMYPVVNVRQLELGE